MTDYMDKLRNSTILITGATGMIGQSLIRRLMELNNTKNMGIHIIAHVRSKRKAEDVLSFCVMRDEVEIIVSDITELSLDMPVDYMIHTAGVTGGSKQHIDYPMRTISAAIDGTKRVLEIAREKECKGFVYLSSLEVYGKVEAEGDISECHGGYIDPVNVRSSYSESKRMCECMCAAYTKQYGVPAVIARLTATFGPGVRYEDNRVFAQFARSVIEKKNIVLKSTGETVRNYCDVEDAGDAILLLSVKGCAGEAYNIANPSTEISIRDMAERFVTLFPESGIHVEFDLKEDTTKLGYNATLKSVLSAEKLVGLGWQPKYELDDTIKRLVASMKKGGNV